MMINRTIEKQRNRTNDTQVSSTDGTKRDGRAKRAMLSTGATVDVGGESQGRCRVQELILGSAIDFNQTFECSPIL